MLIQSARNQDAMMRKGDNRSKKSGAGGIGIGKTVKKPAVRKNSPMKSRTGTKKMQTMKKSPLSSRYNTQDEDEDILEQLRLNEEEMTR